MDRHQIGLLIFTSYSKHIRQVDEARFPTISFTAFCVCEAGHNPDLSGASMKKILLSSALVYAGSLVTFLAVPVAAQASDGTITFKGKLVSTTCTISVNGGSNSATVSLPTVATTALTSAGQIAGGTRFSIVLSACSKQTGSAVAYFEPGDGVNSADNNLRNTETTTPAGNVEVQLTNLTGTAIKIGDKASQEAMSTGTPPAPLNGAPIVDGAATLSYVASYYATGQSTTGAVTANVTYSIDYF